MKHIETRRRVPAAALAMICVSLLGLFQLLMLTGAYRINSGWVRKAAPWLYTSFRKMVGEHPSTRPKAVPAAKSTRDTEVETVTGIRANDLSIRLDGTDEERIEEQPAEIQKIIPVSKPEQPDPLDSDKPVG